MHSPGGRSVGIDVLPLQRGIPARQQADRCNDVMAKQLRPKISVVSGPPLRWDQKVLGHFAAESNGKKCRQQGKFGLLGSGVPLPFVGGKVFGRSRHTLRKVATAP